MKAEECLSMMDQWYSNNAPIYEIVFQKDIRRREFAVIAPKHLVKSNRCKGVRHMSILGVDTFKYCLNKVLMFREEENVFNFYKGLVQYHRGVPKMNPVLKFRVSSIEQWKSERKNQIVACDLFIDIDSPNRACIGVAKEDAKKIHLYLCKFGMPHTLTFSGMGYHLIIPYYCFEHLGLSFDPDSAENTYYGLFNDVCKVLSEKFSELVDTNGLHDSMRITKLPYSLTFYKDGCYVCWPFVDELEFEQHGYTDYKLNVTGKFRGEKHLVKRGVKLFYENIWGAANTDAFLLSLGVEISDKS